MNKGLKKMARFGFVAKGVVYAITGVLVFLAAVNMGGDTPSKMEVLDFLENQPFGNVILILMALGLASFAAWRLIQSISDPEGIGNDVNAKLKRTGFFISGLLYLSLAGAALIRVIGAIGSSGSGGGSSDSAQKSDFLATTTGLVVLGITGVVIIIIGAIRIHKAYKEKFIEKFDFASLNEEKRRQSIKSTAKLGLTARGLLFFVIGFFFLKAAFSADLDEIKSTAEVFSFIHQSSYGAWMLGFVGLGLIAYALYMFLLAKYRKFKT